MEGVAEDCLTGQALPGFSPENEKRGMAVSVPFPGPGPPLPSCAVFVHRSWCRSVIMTQRKCERLAVRAVYLSSPELYWSVEKGRKSGQA